MADCGGRFFDAVRRGEGPRCGGCAGGFGRRTNRSVSHRVPGATPGRGRDGSRRSSGIRPDPRNPYHLPAGKSRIRFEGVADGIEPVSAIVAGLPVGVVEKNLDADLLSPATLLAAA